MKLRKLILKIHLYGGLLCFWYLIIFAVSSLFYQHHFHFMSARESEGMSYEKKLQVPVSDNLNEMAQGIQNELGIAGWYLPWETRRDKDGIIHTQIQNPVAQYLITFDQSSSEAKYTRKEKGFWPVFNSLHGFAGEMPNAPLLVIWKLFTWLSVIVVTFSIFSGIWLWMRKSSDRLAGLVTFTVIVILSFSFMIYVYFHG